MLRINYYGLTKEELGKLAKRTISVSKGMKHPDVLTNPLLTNMEKWYEDFDLQLIHPCTSEQYSSIADADWLRDTYYKGLLNALRGACAFKGTTRAKIAIPLLKIFNDAGDISKLSYSEENIGYEELIKKLDLPENMKIIEQLSITEEIEALKKSQRDFMKLYNENIACKSQLLQQTSASSLRHELQNSLRDFYAYISAQNTTSPWKEIYTEIINIVRNRRADIIRVDAPTGTNVYIFG